MKANIAEKNIIILEEDMDKNIRIAIIGGGPAGLSAGMYLEQKGYVYAATKQQPILPVPLLTRKAIRSLHVSRKTKIKLRILQLIGIKNLCILHRLFHPKRHVP